MKLAWQLMMVAVICMMIGLPVLALLKMGWWIGILIMGYLLMTLGGEHMAKTLRSGPMNPFKAIRKVCDLEQRHVALLVYLKLKETLIPRHWKVEKEAKVEV